MTPFTAGGEPAVRDCEAGSGTTEPGIPRGPANGFVDTEGVEDLTAGDGRAD